MGWFSRDDARQQQPSGPTPGTVEAVEAALHPYVRWLRSLGAQVPGRAMVLCRLIGDHLEDVVGTFFARVDDDAADALRREAAQRGLLPMVAG